MDRYGNILLDRARPDLPDTRYTPTYSSSSLNWWQRLNNFVIDIGNWFADHIEDITSGAMAIAGIGTIIGLLIWVIGVFSDEGMMWGILSIFGACCIGYIIFAIIGLASYVLGFIMLIVRFAFWNIYTLLLALVILGLVIFSNLNEYNYRYDKTPVEHVAQETTQYYCTAKTFLYVRSSPNKNAKVIGRIEPYQYVEVYEVSNGFARVKLKDGSVGYASSTYLKKRN